VNFTTLNPVTFDAANTAGIETFNVVAGSMGSLTLTNLEADTGLALNTGFADTLAFALANEAGLSDDITVTIDGTVSGAVVDYTGVALEMLNLVVNGSTLSADAAGASFFGGAAAVVVTGAGDLTLEGFDPDFDAGVNSAPDDLEANAIDTTGLTGSLTLSPAAASAAVIIDFTAGAMADLQGVDTYVINDTAAFAHTLTFGADAPSLTVEIASIAAASSAGALTVSQGPTAIAANSLTVNLGGEGDGMGALTAALTGDVTVNSSGTTANAVAGVTLATTIPLLSEMLTITGDQALDVGTVNACVVNAGGFDAGLTVGLTALATCLEVNCDSGAGADDVTGTANIDVITAGDGANTITGAAGDDLITVGTVVGDDNTFVLNSVFAAAATPPVDVDGNDQITGFDSGDSIQLDVSNTLSTTLTNTGAVANNSIDISNDTVDTTIIIDLDTDGTTTVSVTVTLLGVVLDDTGFTFDATTDLLTAN